ncbi:MAG: PrsW family intramembrane metalloprotease, partial [Leptospiraceae bacterium]|nr:PrsW family intramembrane metalloprotease [Leptospiraceae bacterium]
MNAMTDYIYVFTALFAFLSVAPYLLLLNVKSIGGYGGIIGRWIGVWMEHLHMPLRRMFSPAVWAGLAVGFLSTFVVEYSVKWIFPEFQLALRPAEPLAWSLQIAFIQAGLFEEFVKCGLALILCVLICYRGKTSQTNDGMFYSTAVFACAAVGLGFALRENFGYLNLYGGLSPTGMFVGRTFAAAMHMLINWNFGLTLLQARRSNVPGVVARGLLVAIMQHGVYDFFAIPPVAFAQFLAYLWFCLLFMHTIRRMYRMLPETRTHSLQSRTELETNPFVRAIPAPEEFKRRPGTAARPMVDRFEESKVPGLPIPFSTLEDALLRATPAGVEFRRAFGEQVRVQQLPDGQETPFALSDLSFLSPALLEVLNVDQYRGEVPERLRHDWRLQEQNRAGLLRKSNMADAVWDSSICAANADAIDAGLQKFGVSLKYTVPLRCMEFYAVGPQASRFIYISTGLQTLYGHEFWLSFPHPYPSARWIFLWLASFDAPQAP